MTTVTLRLRHPQDPRGPMVEVDLCDLTPKARALAEAIHASTGHRPLGVLCDTGKTKADSPNHRYLYGTGPEAEEIGRRPDLRFITNLEPIPQGAETTPEEWLEYNARQLPYDAWPIAGARSRMEPLKERVPSADAAREDRCLTRDQTMHYLAEAGIVIGRDAWWRLVKAEAAPAPRHYALGGRMPLWHVDDLDAYINRPYERWPLSRVAEHLGYSGPPAAGSARKQLSRWGLHAVGRAPGRGGESLYAADQVQALHASRPGRGRHGAPRESGKFTSSKK